MSRASESVRFVPLPVSGCREGCGTRHFHGDVFRDWFKSLTDEQRQSLRDKAKWEHMTLSAVAMEWGVAKRMTPASSSRSTPNG